VLGKDHYQTDRSLVFTANSQVTKEATMNYKAYDKPTRGGVTLSEHTQENNPLFHKEQEQEEEGKIKLKNVKHKWREDMEEEQKVERKEATPKQQPDTQINKVQGSFGETPKEVKKVVPQKFN